jgi:hypothetical protein
MGICAYPEASVAISTPGHLLVQMGLSETTVNEFNGV